MIILSMESDVAAILEPLSSPKNVNELTKGISGII